jgi:hypothetical protein
VNLPISTQVVGSRASRSTHPRSLMLLEQLALMICDQPIRIDNPFIWKTKSEILRDLFQTPEREAIRRTLSCVHTRDIDTMHPHCGACAQCLQRRIAILGAGAAEADPAEGYANDLLLSPRQEGSDRALAVDMIRSALEYSRLSNEEFATRFASELAWVRLGFPHRSASDVAQNFCSLFHRFGKDVRAILVDATRQHASALVDKMLPDSCLLRLVHDPPYTPIIEAQTVRVRRQLDEENEAEVYDGGWELRIAVEEHAKQILIDGISPLKASSEFRLVFLLVSLYVEDRNSGRMPAEYRTLSAQDLADASARTDDTSGRQAVSRLRRKISKEYKQLYGVALSLNALIENVHGKGYRLNPSVRVVAPDALKN